MQIFEKDWADKSAYHQEGIVSEVILCLFILAITIVVML